MIALSNNSSVADVVIKRETKFFTISEEGRALRAASIKWFILAFFVALSALLGIQLEAANREIATQKQTVESLEVKVHNLTAENQRIKAAYLYNIEQTRAIQAKLDRALVPEASVVEAFEVHVAQPTVEVANNVYTNVSNTSKSLWAKAVDVFKQEEK